MDWFTKNKYIQRYTNYHAKIKEETTNNKIEDIKQINNAILNMSKLTTNTANGLLRKHYNNMKQYSKDQTLALDYLDIDNPDYKTIKQDEKECELRPVRIQEIVLNVLQIDEKLVSEQDTHAILDEALERNNKPRFQENKETIQKMYEEYQDEEY